jgi:hypothetical protein
LIATPDLIESLATGLKPAPRRFVSRRLGLGIGSGLVLITAAVLLAWGPRADFSAALSTPSFWIKFAFTGVPMLGGIVAVLRLSRPDGRIPRALWFGLASVVLTMAGMAAAQLLNAPAADHRSLIMGSTAAACPWLIMLLAVPVLAGTLWAMRALAPTRLTLAGAAAGLVAGAAAAFIYALSCGESAIPFVLIWYGLGMAVPTIAGALIGNRLLRW